MSQLRVTEYKTEYTDNHGNLPIVRTRDHLADQSVNITSGVVQSAPFNALTQIIRMQAEADCHVSFGANPTVSTGAMPLSAGIPEWISVTAGEKLAVIAD